MKVSYLPHLHARIKGDFDIIKLLDEIKNGVHVTTVLEVRNILNFRSKKAYNEAKEKLACFTPSGTFAQSYSTKQGKEGKICPPKIDALKEYNGIVVLDYDDLEALDLFSLAEKVKACTYTFSSFFSPSNQGYKVLVKTTNSDPALHSEAFRQVSEYYFGVTGYEDDKSSSNVNRLCYMGVDVALYLNESSRAFKFVPPPPKEKPIQQDLFFVEEVKPKVAQPPTKTATITDKETQKYLEKAVQKVEKKGISFLNGQRHNFVKHFSIECYKYGIDQKDCVDFVDSNFVTADCNATKVLDIVAWAYGGNIKEEFGLYRNWTKEQGKESKTNKEDEYLPELYKEKRAEENIIALPEVKDLDELDDKVASQIKYLKVVENKLNEFFDFRINVLKDNAEYKQKEWTKWREVTKIENNSISRALMLHGVSCPAPKLESIILSHFSKQVHPVKDIFEHWGAKMDENDTTDYIRIVSDFVKTDAPKDLFYNIFKKWLVASVANVFIETQCTNHHCIILCGNQGTNKTTFLSSLFLSEYVFMGHLDLTNKDSLIMLTDTFLVVVDEQFSVLSKEKDWEALKSAITMPRIKTRWVYAKSNKLAPRIANFCGTSNRIDILQDDTGNRRFIPFQLTEPIDLNAFRKVDITKMWGQAYKLYKENWFYLPTSQEKRQIDQYQAGFKKLGNEHFLIQDMYEPCPENDPEILHLSSTELWKILDKDYNLGKEITIARIGRALSFLGYEQKTFTRSKDNKRGRYWLLKRI